MASLAQLLKVQSQAASSSLVYLDAMGERLRFQPLLRLVGRSLEAEEGRPLLRVPLKCLPFNLHTTPAALEARERDRGSGRTDRHDQDEYRLYHRRPGRDRGRKNSNRDFEEDEHERRRELDEEKCTPPEPPVPLAERIQTLRRAWIVADPGGGKTEFLKVSALDAAEAAAGAIRAQALLADDLCLPVWVSLPLFGEILLRFARWEVAPNGGAGAPDPVATFVEPVFGFLPQIGDNVYRQAAALILRGVRAESLKDGQPTLLGPVLRRLWDSWTSPERSAQGGILAFFDALDEVANDARPLVHNRLRSFLAGFPGRTLVSSRIAGFNLSVASPDARRTGGSEQEAILEVQPFKATETEQFLRAYFHPKDHLAEHLIAELRAKPALHGMAKNPLLATLFAIAFSPGGRPLTLPARRGEVYEVILDRLLGADVQGDHKGRSFVLGDDERRTVRRALNRLALHFFPDERLCGDAVASLIREMEREPEVTALGQRWLCFLQNGVSPPTHCAWLLDFLQHYAGLLIPLGDGKHLRFLHLTFQEFGVAEALAEAVRAKGWETAAVYVNERENGTEYPYPVHARVRVVADCKANHSAWREAIILFAGRLDNPHPLLELLADKRRDFATHDRLALAGLCLGELCDTTQVKVAAMAQRIERDLLRALEKYRRRDLQAVITYVTCGLRVAVTCVESLNTNSEGSATWRWIAGGSGNWSLAGDFVNLFAVQFGLSFLKKALEDEKAGVNWSAKGGIKAMAEHALWSELLPVFRGWLDDKCRAVQCEAVQGITALAGRAPWDQLLPLYWSFWEDGNWDSEGIEGITKLAGHAPWDQLMPAIRFCVDDEDSDMRLAGIECIAMLVGHAPAAELLPLLRKGLDDRREHVRSLAIEGIWALAGQAPLAELLPLGRKALEDLNYDVREAGKKGIRGLVRRAPWNEILPVFQEWLDDEDWSVREGGCEAIVALVGHAPWDVLLQIYRESLANEDWDVCGAGRAGILALTGHAPGQLLLPVFREWLVAGPDYVRPKGIKGIAGLAGHVPWTELLPLLRMALDDESDLVRSEGIEGVAALGGHAPWKELLPPLRRALEDESDLVRFAGIEGIGTLAVQAPWEDLLPFLRAILDDREWEMRRAGIKAIAALAGRAPWTELLPLLRKALDDSEVDVRVAGINGFGALARHAPWAPLLRVVRKWLNDADNHVCQAGIEGTAGLAEREMREQAAIDAVVTRFHADGFRWRVSDSPCPSIGRSVRVFSVRRLVQLRPLDRFPKDSGMGAA